jgi:hypothetical protein
VERKKIVSCQAIPEKSNKGGTTLWWYTHRNSIVISIKSNDSPRNSQEWHRIGQHFLKQHVYQYQNAKLHAQWIHRDRIPGHWFGMIMSPKGLQELPWIWLREIHENGVGSATVPQHVYQYQDEKPRCIVL